MVSIILNRVLNWSGEIEKYYSKAQKPPKAVFVFVSPRCLLGLYEKVANLIQA